MVHDRMRLCGMTIWFISWSRLVVRCSLMRSTAKKKRPRRQQPL
nr:MAG TPA: hypothetical protein [Caudoviricetes sp.]